MYTVRWETADLKKNRAVFPNHEEAAKFKNKLTRSKNTFDVKIYRAGRNEHPNWDPVRRTQAERRKRRPPRGGLTFNEDAWFIPEGYVDTEQDKHGPIYVIPVSQRKQTKTDKEKAEYYKKYKPDNKTCLWH